MSFLSTVIADSQTTITCVFGAALGALGDMSGKYVTSALGFDRNTSGLGREGLTFVVHALTATAFFALGDAYLPETSSNVFYSVLFFAASPTLVQTGIQLGRTMAGGPIAIVSQSTATSPGVRASCASGSCGK